MIIYDGQVYYPVGTLLVATPLFRSRLYYSDYSNKDIYEAMAGKNGHTSIVEGRTGFLRAITDYFDLASNTPRKKKGFR